MKEFNLIPRIDITHTPTPLEFAPRLSKDLGCNLFIKRDDCTGLAGGGNKARKLEYLLADAQQQGADTLVTIGGLQSNHARQTAAVAAKFGFGCELVLEDVAGTPKTDYYDNGNVLLDRLFGADLVWAVFADFGNVGWVPGVEKVELEGEGLGMIRHLTVPVYPQLHERLESIDYGAKVLEYSIPNVEYIGVKDYRARAQVVDLDAGRCRVLMSCRAEADGVPETEAARKTGAFYEAMLGWVDDFVKQAPTSAGPAEAGMEGAEG